MRLTVGVNRECLVLRMIGKTILGREEWSFSRRGMVPLVLESREDSMDLGVLGQDGSGWGQRVAVGGVGEGLLKETNFPFQGLS